MYITALDLGTSQIRAIVTETQKDGKLSLLSVLKIPSIGLRKGEIASLDEAVHSLNRIINEIKQINKSAAKIFLSISAAVISNFKIPVASSRFRGLTTKFIRTRLTARLRPRSPSISARTE